MNTTVKAVEGYMFRARKKIIELIDIKEDIKEKNNEL